MIIDSILADIKTAMKNKDAAALTALRGIHAQIKDAIDVPVGKGTLIGFPTRYNANLQIGVWDSAHFTAE